MAAYIGDQDRRAVFATGLGAAACHDLADLVPQLSEVPNLSDTRVGKAGLAVMESYVEVFHRSPRAVECEQLMRAVLVRVLREIE
jgi:hypothetical protein